MTLVPITSFDDPLVAPYHEMNRRNLAQHSGLFIVEGDKLVDRLITSSFAMHSLLAEPDMAERYATQVPAEVPIYVVDRATLQATIGFNFHRGILGCGYRREHPTVEQLLTTPPTVAQVTAGRAADIGNLILVLAEVQDPTNLGSILRSAAAFGCRGVVLGPRCADPFARRVIRVSMGSALTIPITVSSNLACDLESIAEQGYQLTATVLSDRAKKLGDLQLDVPRALLMGSEGNGLAPEWIAMCREHVTIPMAWGTDSLNVAIAAAVLLYHFSASRLC